MSETKAKDESANSDEAPAGVDPQQTKPLRELSHDRPLLCCRFDPGGSSVAAGSHDHNVVRWDLKSEEKTLLAAHDTWVNCVAYSRDGSTLVSGGCDGRLIWWENSGSATKPIRTVDAHQGWVRAVDVSPDGTLIATSGDDKLVRIFGMDDGEQVAELSGHELYVYSVMFHPNGQFVLSGDLLGSIRHWNVASGEQVRTLDAKKLNTFNSGQRVNYGGIRSLALSLDGTQLAAGGLHKATNPLGNVQEPLVVVFDWESGEERRTLEVGETKPLSISRLLYHPAGFLIGATRYNESLLLFWKGEETTAFHKHKVAAGGLDCDLHPDHLQIATAHADGKVRISQLDG